MSLPNPSTEREQHGFLRAAAVSPALRLGDVTANVQVISKVSQELAEQGCRLAVFPELCLTGYSCADLFHTADLQRAALTGLLALTEATKDLATLIVVGLPLGLDGRLYNVAAVVFRGEVLGIVPKTFLPNSGEFYERRWFSPAATLRAPSVAIGGVEVPLGTDLLFEALDLPGFVLGIEICEDLWTVVPPSSHAALAGATVLANLSASNEVLGKVQYRRGLVSQQAARCLAAYVYAGAGAGESSTDVVYSGHCMVAENGAMLKENERFSFGSTYAQADLDLQHLQHERQRSSAFRDDENAAIYRRLHFQLGEATAQTGPLLRTVNAWPFVPPPGVDRRTACEEIFAIQATGLARRLKQVRAKSAVIGLSGGLDSTLAILVLLDALKRIQLGKEVALAITMPGLGTTNRTKGNAEKLAEALGVTLRTIPIGPAVQQHFADIGHPPTQYDVTFENSQARERTQILMDVANQTNGIVIGTGDLSEAALGWCTFNGDHMSMYHVNAGVPKTLVRYLIEWCAEELYAADAGVILHDIIDTPISPELLPANAEGTIQQKTEDTVGPYELHDFFLFHYVRHGAPVAKICYLAAIAFDGRYTVETIERWLAVFLKRFAQSQFKRSSVPDGPKVGSVALSPRGDWRMPSDFAGDLGTL